MGSRWYNTHPLTDVKWRKGVCQKGEEEDDGSSVLSCVRAVIFIWDRRDQDFSPSKEEYHLYLAIAAVQAHRHRQQASTTHEQAGCIRVLLQRYNATKQRLGVMKHNKGPTMQEKQKKKKKKRKEEQRMFCLCLQTMVYPC